MKLRCTLCIIAEFVWLAPHMTAQSGSPGIVVSQVYGGGGNSGATVRNDFVELFNRGTTAITVTGWSIQYASASGSSWVRTLLSGVIQPGQYYLVQEHAQGGGSVSLPTPDLSDAIDLSATDGKIALVNNSTLLSGTAPSGSQIIDFFGYGSANASEGSPAAALSNTTAAIRQSGGCTDTNNNRADFSVGSPSPRNSHSQVNLCAPAVVKTPTISSISPGTPTVSASNQTVTVFGGQFQSGLTVTVFLPNGSGSSTLSGTQIQGVGATSFQMIIALSVPGTFGIRVNNPDGGQSGTFNFNVAAATSTPAIDPNRTALNSASFNPGAVAPGSLVSIFGTNFASVNTLADSIPLPTSLANVSVTFNGIAAPLSGVFHDAVNGDQINVQVPWSVPTPATAQVVVTRSGASSPAQPISIAAASPGIFAIQLSGGQVVGSGLGQAIAYGNSDGIIAAPVGAITGLATHPAKINDPTSLVILATGLGPVDTTVKNGDVPAVITSSTLTKPTVTIGDVPAQVVFSGMVGRDASGKALGFVGVYQINVIVGPGTPTGNAVKLQISMNGVTSRPDVTIAVSQ
jgi:uncharacterized protein (TIGR03437 family)